MDWVNLAKDGYLCWAVVNTVMTLRIRDMVKYSLTIFATVGFSDTEYRGDGTACFPTLITSCSSSDASTRTDGRTDACPIKRS